MYHSVVFLVLACKFVLLDYTVGIIIGMSAEHKSVLGTAVHSLGIHVIARFAVPYKPATLLP